MIEPVGEHPQMEPYYSPECPECTANEVVGRIEGHILGFLEDAGVKKTTIDASFLMIETKFVLDCWREDIRTAVRLDGGQTCNKCLDDHGID